MFCASFIIGPVLVNVFCLLVSVNFFILRASFIIGPVLLNQQVNK
jgi:hypothetical protein